MPLRKLQIRREEGVSGILVTRGLLGAVQCGKGKGGGGTCEPTLHPCRAELGFLPCEEWGERRAPTQVLGFSPSNRFLVRGLNFLLTYNKLT